MISTKMIDTQNEPENPEGSCIICHKDLKDASSLCFDCEEEVMMDNIKLEAFFS